MTRCIKLQNISYFMTAHIIYSIVEALPRKEQIALYKMLKEELENAQSPKPKRDKLITEAEADAYILKHVFNRKIK
jgi:hypothetical protein